MFCSVLFSFIARVPYKPEKHKEIQVHGQNVKKHDALDEIGGWHGKEDRGRAPRDARVLFHASPKYLPIYDGKDRKGGKGSQDSGGSEVVKENVMRSVEPGPESVFGSEVVGVKLFLKEHAEIFWTPA